MLSSLRVGKMEVFFYEGGFQAAMGKKHLLFWVIKTNKAVKGITAKRVISTKNRNTLFGVL